MTSLTSHYTLPDIIFQVINSRSEARKPHNFDRNSKMSVISKKEQPKSIGRKPRGNLNTSYEYGFSAPNREFFPLNQAPFVFVGFCFNLYSKKT